MPFPQPPTNSITIPTGATSGARIVIDGDTDTITVYDANDVAVITITASFSVGLNSGPALTFNPDTAPAPSPWTELGYLTAEYDPGTDIGSVQLAAPSLGSPPGSVYVDSGTPASGGADSNAQISAGAQGEAGLDGGTVRLNPTTDNYPKAGPFGSDHNLVAGEWHVVNVTVNSGTTSGTTVLTYSDTYSAAPLVWGFIMSASGGAIRATAFCSARNTVTATIRVDTNAALGSTTTFPVAVLVVPVP